MVASHILSFQLLLVFLSQLFALGLPWSVEFLHPPTSPTHKNVLFVSNFDVNTEVNQMLNVAEELRDRGHRCVFIALDFFGAKINERGFEFHGIKSVLNKGDTGSAFYVALQKMQLATTWDSYIKGFLDIPLVTSDLYEPTLLVIKEAIEARRPDVIYASMFSDVAIDLAVKYDIPLVINYACNLGHLFDYEDSPATPDGFLWARRDEHVYLWSRLKKFLRLPMLIFGTMEATSKVNQVREKYGIPAVYDPLTNWARAAVIVHHSFGLQIARPLRPLTFMIGISTTPFNPQEDIKAGDMEIKEILDSKSGGVVYCALGSLAFLKQDAFNELVAGLAGWVAAAEHETSRGAIFTLNAFASQHLELGMVPSSVHIYESWVNQKLILNHNNTKVFVTHAGLASIGESIMSMTPMLAIPLFGDQMNNAQRLEEAGVAMQVHQRVQPIVSSDITNKLQNLTYDLRFSVSLARQYQINARSGGVKKAADVVEDTLLFGHLDHLIPANEVVPFPANCNFDLYFLVAMVFMFIMWFIYGLTIRLFKAVINPIFSRVESKSKID